MLPSGTILSNRYKIIQSIARGGMSNIYLCENLNLSGKRYVIKEMVANYTDSLEQDKALMHFKREASLLANLEHRNLPKVTDFFEEKKNHYFVMEFVEGEDLSKILSNAKTPLPEKVVLDWGVQIATVLYFLHCRKPHPVIFRDIKPSNIMVSGNTIKLIDFGIARHFSPGKKGDTMRIGSPGYAPPEQYSGQTDQRSDLFSLGVTLYQLLTLYDPSSTQTPFKFPPVRSLNTNVSPKMASIIEKAIQIDPSMRYQSAIDLKKDLQNLLPSSNTSQQNAPLSETNERITTNTFDPKTGTSSKKSIKPYANKKTSVSFGPPALNQQPVIQSLSSQGSSPGKNVKAAKKSGNNKIRIGLLIVVLFSILLYPIISSKNDISVIFNLITKYISDLTDLNNGDVVYNRDYPEDLILRKAIINLNDMEYKQALEKLEKLRNDFPDDGEALLFLNNTYISASLCDKTVIGLELSNDGSRANPEIRRIYQGLSLAQHIINKNGGIKGKKILIKPYTTKNNKRKIMDIAKEFCRDTQVNALIGGFEPNQIKLISEEIERNDLLTINIFPLPAGMNNDSLLSISSLPYSSSKAMNEFIGSCIKPTDFMVISENADSAVYDIMIKGIKFNSNKIFQLNEKSDDIIKSIKENKISHILLLPDISKENSRSNLSLFINKIIGIKLNTSIIVDEKVFYYLSSFLPESFSHLNIYSVLSSFSENLSSPYSDFINEFHKTFNLFPAGTNSAIAYDSLTLIANGLEKGFSRQSIKDYVNNLESNNTFFTGASGTLKLKSGSCMETVWFGIEKQKAGKIKLINKFLIN